MSSYSDLFIISLKQKYLVMCFHVGLKTVTEPMLLLVKGQAIHGFKFIYAVNERGVQQQLTDPLRSLRERLTRPAYSELPDSLSI